MLLVSAPVSSLNYVARVLLPEFSSKVVVVVVPAQALIVPGMARRTGKRSECVVERNRRGKIRRCQGKEKSGTRIVMRM